MPGHYSKYSVRVADSASDPICTGDEDNGAERGVVDDGGYP